MVPSLLFFINLKLSSLNSRVSLKLAHQVMCPPAYQALGFFPPVFAILHFQFHPALETGPAPMSSQNQPWAGLPPSSLCSGSTACSFPHAFFSRELRSPQGSSGAFEGPQGRGCGWVVGDCLLSFLHQTEAKRQGRATGDRAQLQACVLAGLGHIRKLYRETQQCTKPKSFKLG